MMTRRRLFGIGIMLLVVSAIVVSMWMRSTPDVAEEVTTTAPRKAPSTDTLVAYDTSASVLQRDEVTAKQHIVVSWATWCRLCADTLRDLERVQNERAEPLAVLAVNRAEPDPIARSYLVREFSNSSITFVSDQEDRYFAEAEGYAMPELLFVSPDGDVLYHHRGPITYDELVSRITALSL